ncbi:hypothetical protein BC828DRAFT_393384 [Blastocladiella britannica]|nr:hypothetical protein BC828DRAFT_393384 [Blastocladiella britannica]
MAQQLLLTPEYLLPPPPPMLAHSSTSTAPANEVIDLCDSDTDTDTDFNTSTAGSSAGSSSSTSSTLSTLSSAANATRPAAVVVLDDMGDSSDDVTTDDDDVVVVSASAAPPRTTSAFNGTQHYPQSRTMHVRPASSSAASSRPGGAMLRRAEDHSHRDRPAPAFVSPPRGPGTRGRAPPPPRIVQDPWGDGGPPRRRPVPPPRFFHGADQMHHVLQAAIREAFQFMPGVSLEYFPMGPAHMFGPPLPAGAAAAINPANYMTDAQMAQMDYETLLAGFGTGAPVAPPGLTEAQWNALPKRSFRPLPAEAAAAAAERGPAEILASKDTVMTANQVVRPLHPEHADPTCVICMVEYEKGDQLVDLPGCAHVMHAQCLQPWLKTKTTCPMCRVDVRDGAAQQTPAPSQPQTRTPSRTYAQVASGLAFPGRTERVTRPAPLGIAGGRASSLPSASRSAFPPTSASVPRATRVSRRRQVLDPPLVPSVRLDGSASRGGGRDGLVAVLPSQPQRPQPAEVIVIDSD